MPDTTRGAPATRPPIVEVRALTKSFGNHTAVDHVDLRVVEREIFGLIGPNGAGKSTMLKMLATLLPPTSGEATIAGCDLKKDPRGVRARLGYVPQLLSADGSLTGYENLLLSARLYLIPRDERARRIRDALEMFGLTAAANQLAQHYSGGMLRRLEIAQSMIHRPPVLIMDEPTVGLDPVARDVVWRHVRDLRDRYGTTIVLTTHVMEEVDALCDRIGILHRGRLEKSGSPAELKAAIGPNASLDDVFAAIAGGDIESSGNLSEVRYERRSSADHG
ncbi:MAG TPA: ATP-binding cassette domain-containing protein [Bauldia sp.]|nr:ATP-binding cassette domain-containing protein [Bauldia sp.]